MVLGIGHLPFRVERLYKDLSYFRKFIRNRFEYALLLE